MKENGLGSTRGRAGSAGKGGHQRRAEGGRLRAEDERTEEGREPWTAVRGPWTLRCGGWRARMDEMRPWSVGLGACRWRLAAVPFFPVRKPSARFSAH